MRILSIPSQAARMEMGQATKLTLRIEADGADAEELDVMTGQLLAEVRAGTDVDVAELRSSAVKLDYLIVSGPDGRLFGR